MVIISGSRLRDVRLRAGLTILETAKASNLRVTTIRGLESGRWNRMTDRTLIGLAKAFGVDAPALRAQISVENDKGENVVSPVA